MASWLTHLRIAEKIKQRIEEIEFPCLLMGSIAPDSGMPDESRMNYTPSKETTHCRCKDKDGTYIIDEAAFFNKHLTPEKIITRSDGTRSFLWGYYFHIITDKMWFEQYFKPFREDYLKNSGDTEADFINFIRDEMYSLDFKYLKVHGNELIDELNNANVNTNFFNDFDPDFINECRRRIVEFYSGEPPVLNREYKYLTPEIIDEFVIKTSEKCIDILII